MKNILCVIGIHSYELMKNCTVTRYYKCKRCNTRTYTIRGGCFQPLDRQWLRGGNWQKMTPPSTPRK